MRVIALVLSLIILSAPAVSQEADFYLSGCSIFVSGGEDREQLLLRQQGYCVGAIEAMLLINPALREEERFCPPATVTRAGAIHIVLAYTYGRTDLKRPLAEVIHEAFRDRWPCQS